MAPRMTCKRVIRDTMATKMCKSVINNSLLNAKKMAYFLHIIPLLLENWNSHLEIL